MFNSVNSFARTVWTGATDLSWRPSNSERSMRNVISSRNREAAPRTLKTAWRPVTLQPAVLLTVILFTVAVIIAIQVLRQFTTSDNGISFSSSNNATFSTFTTFAYLYFPTIIAVLFSMLWSWIDLDVKRLEPFYQMASPKGATACNSLLLRYPFDYVALVPIQAARRRHWSVFFSGTITVLIFWAITPLQNSMISTSEVDRVLTANALTSANINAVNALLPSLDLDLLQNAWATLWYNQSLPAFTTANSSFAPFTFDSGLASKFPGASITGDSSRFWTSFDCDNAQFAFQGGNDTQGSAFYVVDKDGCEVNLSIFDTRQIYCGQVGSQADGNDKCSFSRSGQNCGKANHTLLVGYAKTQWGLESDISNGSVTAKFCRMQYWMQPGRLTVKLNDLSVKDFEPSGDPSLLDPQQFDTSEFEAVLATGTNKDGARYGYNNQNQTDGTGNATSISTLEQWAHYNSEDIHPILRPTFAFMYQLMNAGSGQIPSTADAAWLATGFEKTHQFLFALAISDVLSQISPRDASTLRITTKATAVVLVDPLALIVQIFLGLLALLALLLLITSARKPTHLDANPDSLAEVSKLLELDSTTAIALNSLQNGKGIGISQDARFRIRRDDERPHISVDDEEPLENESKVDQVIKPAKLPANKLPFHLSYLCGLLFIAALGAAIGLLAFLQKFSLDNNGIPLPSDNQVVQQLVLNYIPIIFATFVEPFWTLLNRSLCMLQPFRELKTLKASAPASVASRYTSLPPQVVLLRALRNRHWFLASVCLIAISSNILAVTLGALFSVQEIQEQQWVGTSAFRQALFNDTTDIGLVPLGRNDSWGRQSQSFQDHFYVAQSNIRRGTDLPPWTARDFFFMPQNFDDTSASSYTVSTVGFGVRSSCQDLSEQVNDGTIATMTAPLTEEYASQAYQIGLHGMFNNGSAMVYCTTPTASVGNDQAFAVINGTAAFENFDVLVDATSDTSESISFNESAITALSACSDMFIVTYSRTDNATALSAAAAHAVGVTAPSPTHSFPAGADGPCHAAGCRNERKRRDTGFYNLSTQAQPLHISSQTNLVCRTTIVTGNFTVDIDPLGTISNYANVSEIHEDVGPFFQAGDDRRELITRLNSLATGSAIGASSAGTTSARAMWHNTTVARQWFPYLMMLASDNSSAVDSTLPAPPADVLIPAVSNMSALLGSLMLSLYQDRLFPFIPSEANAEQATMLPDGRAYYETSVSRVFLDPTMYIMTMVLLSIHMTAAIIFYLIIPRDVIERLPTTLADQLGFFEGSTLIEDRNWKADWKFGYGRFVGHDGRSRIGIERVPFVQPLNINRQVSWLDSWRK